MQPTAAMPATLHRLVASTVLAALAAAAQAQATSGPRYGSRDDLRQCMAMEDQLKADESVVRQKTQAHDQALKQFQQEMKAHVALQPTVDTSDEAAVTAFNGRTDVLNSRVDALNQEAMAHQATIAELNGRMQAHNRRCAGMVYRIVDMQSIAKERAAAAKAKSGKSM
jgi:uncharacterized iron-regulated membrane protein